MSAAVKGPVRSGSFLNRAFLPPGLLGRDLVRRILLREGRPHFAGRLAIAIWSGLTLAAAVLISRRQGGAFTAEMGAATPCLAGTFAVVLSLSADVLWHMANSAPAPRQERVAFGLAVLPPLGWIAAFWPASFSNPSSPFIGGYLAGLSVVAAVAAVLVADLFTTLDALNGTGESARGAPGFPPQASATPTGATMPAAFAKPAADAREDEVESEDTALPFEENEEADPSILQWMTRRQLMDGGQTVEGAVRIAFDPGSRLAVAHVAFVPPLSGRPEAQCHVLADFNGRVRIGTAMPYGLRIEARRGESESGPLTIEVAFSAQSRAAQTAAA